MSRFGGYAEPRWAPERWTPERFERERERAGRSRGAAVIERDRYEERDVYESHLSPPPGARRRESSADVFYRRRESGPGFYEEKDRYIVEEKYGPPARRPRGGPGRYYDEEIDSAEDSPNRGQMISFERKERSFAPPPRRGPARPTFIRRQSSLDTFDRKPLPRYGDRVREPPEVIPIPVGGRRRSPPRFIERDYEEEIRIAEPDYYGDEEFRGYREREVSTVRTRKDRGEVEIREREEFVVEEEPEREAPRRGKTRMPMRLINKRAIIELGYPYEEEGDTLVILKALSKDHIDEVIKISKEMNARCETRTTYLIEAPAPPPEPQPQVVERRTEIVINPPQESHKPLSEAPRSVREWDAMSSRTERRDLSPSAKTSKSHHSRHRSVSSASTRREIILEEREESSSVHSPLALVVPDRRKDERSIKAEIRALEAEKKALQLEREVEREHRRADRYRDGEVIVGREVVHGDREVIIERERPKETVVKIEKDRKAPNPKLIRAMLGTLT